MIYIILPKVNQVINTLDTIYDQNIMTLAQVFLEIFCSQAYIGLRKMEKGDNFVMDLENFTKVDQVIYTLDTIYDPNIMPLAQASLEIFCSQGYIGL